MNKKNIPTKILIGQIFPKRSIKAKTARLIGKRCNLTGCEYVWLNIRKATSPTIGALKGILFIVWRANLSTSSNVDYRWGFFETK